MKSYAKPSRLRRDWQHRLEYAGVRGFLALAGWIPWRAQGPLAGGLGSLMARVLKIRHETLEQNWAIAFGPLTEERKRTLTREFFRQSILMALDVAAEHRLTLDAIRLRVDSDPAMREEIARLVRGGVGPVFATAHFGNWELGASWVVAISGRRLGVVYKPLHNPYLNRWIVRQRERLGLKLFSTRDTQRALLAHLRDGQPVGILSDQDARRAGTFIPFFGHPASTAMGLAALAIRYRRPLIAIYCERTAPGRYYAHCVKLPEPDPADDRATQERRLMEAYHRSLEDVILQCPAQYFWWHRRWKTRPRGETAGPAR